MILWSSATTWLSNPGAREQVGGMYIIDIACLVVSWCDGVAVGVFVCRDVRNHQILRAQKRTQSNRVRAG